MIGRLFELLFPVYLGFEILVPLWRRRPLFPIARVFFGGFFRGFLTTPSHKGLVNSAQSRLEQANSRMIAAERDLKAAQLEHAAAALEEKANELRKGDDDV
jgi:hypothetical protein